MYYKTSRLMVNMLAVLGVTLCAAAIKLGTISFLFGIVAVGAGVIMHRLHGKCNSCKKHVPTSLGINCCPHCGENLI